MTAKALLITKYRNQIQIAEEALKVCEITHGGRSKGLFTVKNFANEISINSRTLYNWIAIKVNVYDKLKGDPHLERASFTELSRIARWVNSETPLKKVKYLLHKELTQNSFDAKLLRYAKALKSLNYNFKKNAAWKASPATIRQVYSQAKLIIKYIEERYPDIKELKRPVLSNRKQTVSLSLKSTGLTKQ